MSVWTGGEPEKNDMYAPIGVAVGIFLILFGMGSCGYMWGVNGEEDVRIAEANAKIRIAEAEAKIATFKRDRVTEESCL